MKVSKRTKNRMKEHTLVFDWDLTNNKISGFGDRLMVHCKCVDDGCDWFGWLPMDEVNESE